jgi:hypothetical protein
MDLLTLEEKEKTELYYKLESLEYDLRTALEETRMEPGLSLRDISNIIKKVFQPEEIKVLIRELK